MTVNKATSKTGDLLEQMMARARERAEAAKRSEEAKAAQQKAQEAQQKHGTGSLGHDSHAASAGDAAKQHDPLAKYDGQHGHDPAAHFDKLFATQEGGAQGVQSRHGGGAAAPKGDLRSQAEATLGTDGGGTVTNASMAKDLGDIGAHDDPANNKKAAALVKANEAKENDVVKTLSPEQQAQYKTLTDATKDDPHARMALQLNLLEGRLTGGQKSADGQDALGTLSKLADPATPLAPGIDRKQLVSQVTQEIAFPSAIDQHNRNTCGATSMQIMTASENPAEYARLVGGLASPEGKVQMKDGETLSRLPGTENADDSNRTISGRLWQPAVMQFGYSKAGDGAYQNTSDAGGLTFDGAQDALHALTGKDFSQADAQSWRGTDQQMSPDQLFDAMKNQANSGKETFVAIDTSANPGTDKYEGHFVVVTGVDDKNVSYKNPWGQQETMPIDQFKARLADVELEKPGAPAAGPLLPDGVQKNLAKADALDPKSDDYKKALGDAIKGVKGGADSLDAQAGLRAIADRYEKGGDKGRADLLRHLADQAGKDTDASGSDYRNHVLRALEDDKSTQHDLQEAAKTANSPGQFKQIVDVAFATGVDPQLALGGRINDFVHNADKGGTHAIGNEFKDIADALDHAGHQDAANALRAITAQHGKIDWEVEKRLLYSVADYKDTKTDIEKATKAAKTDEEKKLVETVSKAVIGA